jgi:hypothetical protein
MHPRTATYPVAPDLASLLRWPPTLPRVPRPWTSPPYRGGLRRCTMSLSSGPYLPAKVGSGAAMCQMAPASASSRGSSEAATCPTTPSGLWTIGIKKDLTALGTQLGSHISKVCSRVTEAPARHVGMRHHHNLQDVRTSRYSAAQHCSVARLPTHRHGWQGM